MRILLVLAMVLGPQDPGLRVGEGVTDITPPAGTELAGFHQPPGQERRSTGVRQPGSARALVLSSKGTDVAIISLDVCGVSQEFCREAAAEVSRKTSIPARNIRIAATHTHSMPTLRYMHQWGRLPGEYADVVRARIVEAVELARKDQSAAEFRLGKERVSGGNFNRTTKTFRTDEVFTKESSDDDRWLDTTLHALVFARGAAARTLVWYQFSSHPVCYADGEMGPDWPGLVAEKMKATEKISPSFLQGHCGDVNPGAGTPWRGDAEKACDAVVAGLRRAVTSARPVPVDGIRQVSGEFAVPLDLAKHREQLERYRSDPAACTKGEWVDAGFSKEWHDVASKWDAGKSTYGTPVTALRLGDVALLFHSGELYSYYGLAIRRDSPFPDTLVVGYVDDLIGYVPDPKAYEAKEYAAIVVPKILGLPPFKPEVGRALHSTAIDLLKRLKD